MFASGGFEHAHELGFNDQQASIGDPGVGTVGVPGRPDEAFAG